MSLASVLYPAPTPNGMEEWGFAHLNHHKAINNQLVAQRGVNALLYNIYPIVDKNIDDFLEQHQLFHNFMNAVLNLQGQDLSSIDFSKQTQKDSFFYLNFSEHVAAAKSLGMGI